MPVFELLLYLRLGAEVVARLAGADAVENDVELPAARFSWVEQFDCACGQIARVGVEWLPFSFAGTVDAFELFVSHVDLAAHLEHGRRIGDGDGESFDRAHVLRDVVALDAVAPRNGAHECSVFVGQTDCDAVDLRLDQIGERLVGEAFIQALAELDQFFRAVGVV